MPTRRKRPTTASAPPAIIKPIDASRLKTYPLQRRHSKVQVSNFAKVWTKGRSFARFLDSLPDILAVKTLREVAKAIAKAHRRGRPVIVGMGAHVVKVGLGPLLVDLMERGIVTALAMNGAVIIHDFELAFMGHTSEEVDAEIDSGRLNPFGRVVILFERSKGRGHWVGLFRSSKEMYKGKPRVFFFDSYGMKPESELKYSEGKNIYLKQRRNTLLRLFKGQGVKYNDVQLQKWKPKINTCGRWVCCRLSCDDLNSYEFADMIKSLSDDPDQFITDMTNLYL